jgi:DNA invertase Pin-like site-specific DNA recombinase
MDLVISRWFEEQQTAAKQGRPVWNAMLRELRQGRARGVIIHKIDRSARNLKDWVVLEELIDQGVDVHFVNESLDFQSRGGRLSADIQAVVAADYIRNLREEAKKGIYGRLKQGFYPMRAPIGYLDNGAAKKKTIDPAKGPLVRQVFELYGCGQWSVPRLAKEMYRRGLRNHGGNRISVTTLHKILRNPFYMGIIHIRASNQTFDGNHEALVSKNLFDRVQAILKGRVGTRVYIHDFLFRRTIKCAHCERSLIGELKKGHVYYRCHTDTCPTTNVREEVISATVERRLSALQFTEPERAAMAMRIAELKSSWSESREHETKELKIKIERMSDRLNRLTDAYVDGIIEREPYEERRASACRPAGRSDGQSSLRSR